MADGSITFSTSLDNSDLEKQLKEAEKRIDDLKRKIEAKEGERNAIAEQLEQISDEAELSARQIEKLKARLEELRGSDDPNKYAKMDAATSALDKEVSQYEKFLDQKAKLRDKLYNTNVEADSLKERLASAQEEYASIGSAAQAAAAKSNNAFVRAADGIKTRMASTAASVRGAFVALPATIGGVLKKLAPIALAVVGLQKLKNEISSMLHKNEQFNASIENLKAVLRGFLSAFVQAITPALISFVNTLAGVMERVAGLIDSIFGTNILGAIQDQRNQASAAIQAENAKRLADATGKQANAAKKLGKAQKEANRQLMSFDELNVLADETADDAADALDDYADDIADVELMPDWTQSLGDMGGGLFQGVLDWLDMIRDRIANDADGPFARIREGLELIKQGWADLLRGLETGDWKLVWESLGNIAIGALYVIEGSIGAFLDWFDGVTGGRFHTTIEGIKTTLHGIVEFVEGVLRGDLQLAFQGIQDLIDGAALLLEGSIMTTLDTLDALTGGRLHGFFESAKVVVTDEIERVKRILHGLVEFIEGVLTGDADKAVHGLVSVFGELVNSAKEKIGQLVEVVRLGVNGIFDWLEEKLPFLEPILEPIRTIVNDLFGNMQAVISGFFDWVGRTVENVLNIIVGIFTGDGGRILDGLKGLVNRVIDILNGALSAVGEFVNWIGGGICDLINWVAPDAGWSFSFWMPQIPYLAGGAVIPPNREFMAVLGDQTSGNNLEAPESLIRQIVREESGNAQMLAVAQQILAAVQQGKVIECDGYTLGRVVDARNGVAAKIYGR